MTIAKSTIKSKFTATPVVQAVKSRAARKPKAAATAPEADHGGDPINPVHRAQAETIEVEATHSAYERLMRAADDYFATRNMPSWKRQVTSFMLGLITYGATFYAGMVLVDMLIVAVAAYCGYGFITFMTVFIGFVLALIAASSLGYAVYNAAMKFEYSNVKAQASSVKSRVLGFFKRNDVEVSHA